MRIKQLQINHLTNPLGYDLSNPSFSWMYEGEKEEVVESARIVVSKAETAVFDSGYQQLNPLGTHFDMTFEPRTRYTWNVFAKLTNGEEVSSFAWFETGKMDEPWQAKWITTEKEIDRHPFFSKKIQTEEKIVSARMYVIGLGLFEPSINGKKITDEYLMPYCFAYDRWMQALTFDITEYLSGDDEISFLLGNGWYRGRFGFNASNTGPAYGSTLKLLCEIHIVYASGEEEMIGTDDSWSVTRSSITFSNIYDGEIVDDTLPVLPAEKAVYSDEEVPAIKDRYSLPVVRHEVFQPSLIETPRKEMVLDFHQNLTGIFEWKLDIPAGNTVHVSFGEVLQDGNFYRDNLRTAKASFTYTSNGKPVVVSPHFTFYGFRYAKIEGLEQINLEDFTAHAIYSDFAMRGTLKTGNAKVNQLISNALWGMKDNYVDVPTDCPQRDERMGWTGDAQVFSPTAMYFADTASFFRKYLFDMYQEQAALDGLVPFTVPSFHIHSAACVWGDAATLIPYYQYLNNGDLKEFSDSYESMKAWVEYIRKVDGENLGWRKTFHFGDWLALDGPKGKEAVVGRTDEGFIADVYYAKSCRIVSFAAKQLHKEEDARIYEALADTIRKNVLHDYYTGSGRCAVMTMTGQILSLQEGLGNPEEAAAILKKLLKFNEGKLETGFVGTPLLCPVLSDNGMSDLAYNLLLNEEYPGWLYEVNLGATTIWERWNSLDENGKITGIGMNSLNHYSYGSIVQWLFAYGAGLQPLKPGYKEARIRPELEYRLGLMDCTYKSASGEYKVKWEIIDRCHVSMQWSVPYGCKAEVHLPLYLESDDSIAEQFENGIGTFTQGTYAITYRTSEPLDHVITLKTVVKEALQNEKIKAYLEAIPLFEQSEFSYMDLTIKEALGSCRVEEERFERIEEDLINLQ